ncbi:MAG: alpha-amylase family glycosyl hydrolase [Limisphaerales bacterium]
MNFRFFKKVAGALAVGLMLASTWAWADTNERVVARSSPDWLRDGVIYEIFPRDFSPAGNINGVTAKLDELQKLGVNILWLMPIHPIGEKFRLGKFGSPYSVRDYYAIDPVYGTPGDFKRLVVEAHKRKMKVIMDLVADHTAWDSVMMKHPGFYKRDAHGKIISPTPDWTDVAALNYANQGLRKYMIGVLKYWVQRYDIDGFRCDAAAMVPTSFWEQARAQLGRVKPDIIMLAEASKPELLVNAFDIDYSWPLLAAEDKVLLAGAPASVIRSSWEDSLARFPRGALHMRISDDHDEVRAINRYGLKGALAMSALMFTLDGVPLVYNGMEIGDAHETSGGGLFKKLNISWQAPPHPELRAIYHDLIQLRHEYPALCNSRVDWLHNSDETNLLTFLREDDKDELLVVINFADHRVSGSVDFASANGFAPLKISGMEDQPDSPLPALHLDGFEWRIYHRIPNPSRPLTGLHGHKDLNGGNEQ